MIIYLACLHVIIGCYYAIRRADLHIQRECTVLVYAVLDVTCRHYMLYMNYSVF